MPLTIKNCQKPKGWCIKKNGIKDNFIFIVNVICMLDAINLEGTQ